MDTAGASPTPGTPFESLYAEAKQLLAYSANQLRVVTEQFREAHRRVLDEWHGMRDRLTELPVGRDAATDRERAALAGRIDLLTAALGGHLRTQEKLGLAVHTLESAWLFLERGEAAEPGAAEEGRLPAALQMRVLQSEEAERSRLAREVHDGPAQALSNAIFQVDYIERVLDTDSAAARTELRYLRDRLRRELADVRTFISQLRPPQLDRLGLEGAMRDVAEGVANAAELTVDLDFQAPPGSLGDAEQLAVLQVAREALQNVHKHAHATRATVATRIADGDWRLEVRDDGKGFDPGALADRGRRSFGVGLMRERAELIGARLEIESNLGGGTRVRLTIPSGEGGEREDA